MKLNWIHTDYFRGNKLTNYGLNVAVIGARGAVGEAFLSIAEERKFPIGTLKLLASARSEGRELRFRDQIIKVHEVSEKELEGVDLVFCSASSEVSKTWGPWCRENQVMMIDDGSAFRMDDDVPLVVPEINSAALDDHNWIVSIPNCTTTPLVMALDAMRRVGVISRVTATTYQAVSGTGAAAIEELQSQDISIANGTPLPLPEAYPIQIARNVLPHVDEFDEDGFTKEELKMRNETRKILHDYELRFASTCVRVPVLYGHSEVVHVEFEKQVSIEDLGQAMDNYPGIVFDPDFTKYVTPLEAEGRDETFVSRLRPDPSVDNGVLFWCVTDNLRKGAATNALQIAENLIEKQILNIT